MNYKKVNFMFFTLVMIVSGCYGVSNSKPSKASAKAKNIILFIGDGMAVPHVTLILRDSLIQDFPGHILPTVI